MGPEYEWGSQPNSPYCNWELDEIAEEANRVEFEMEFENGQKKSA